jgi:predicted ATPase/DNA-binding SARP family transcriptional activator
LLSNIERAETERWTAGRPVEESPGLEIRLLGPFAVELDGTPAHVGRSKRPALLALLALRRGQVVSVEEAIDALWGEELPAAPRNAVQHHVGRLRAALGAETIAASADGYALANAWVDALRFEDLLGRARIAVREGDARAAADSVARALKLWRGPPLLGLTDMPWFSAEARRLEALRGDLLEEQFEAALALDEHREIVSPLQSAVKENPVRERLWGQLMLALYRSGRQAEALETFQEARRVLLEQTGLDPGPELRRLQASILAHDPAIAAVSGRPRRRGNLPTPATSFVDRERELEEVVTLLREHRLVTLLGPPGVGKSRLALEALRAFESELGDGAWIVELARAGESEDIVRLVAQALDAHGSDPLTRVIARLRDGDATLLLDACEHARAEAARIISAILGECPQVRVLATSREVLRVSGEARVALDPLPFAEDEPRSPAVQLFAARARAARPDFELTDEATGLVAEIARRVDGLPLAIELAAARVNVLGLAELLSMVDRRLPLLDDQPRPDPMRTAVRGLVEWSYDLLHRDEKTLLHQLAVHRGGASLPSLIAVGSCHGLDEATITYLLGTLVDKSIVSVSFPAGEARYDLLDTVRDYALERLSEIGGLAAARQAHAEYFATLAEAGRPGLRGRDWQAWTLRLSLENDNLWSALTYARDTPAPDIAIRLGASLGWYFSFSERVSEGRRFLELARDVAGDVDVPGLRMVLLASICFLATEELDLEAAIEAGEGALELASDARDARETAEVRALLSIPLAQAGASDRAAKLADEAKAASEAAGDHWGAAVASIVGAEAAAVAGDVSTVAALSADAARHSKAIGFLPGLLPATMLEAWAAEQRGDARAAAEVYRRVFELANETRFVDHAAFALARLGSAALADRDSRQAEKLFRRALAAADAAHAPWVTAYARVQLGRILAAAGDVSTAERLYRSALEWSERPRPHRARESLFLMLAGSPGMAALQGLAELATVLGDAEAAAELRARAALAPA